MGGFGGGFRVNNRAECRGTLSVFGDHATKNILVVYISDRIHHSGICRGGNETLGCKNARIQK